MFPNPLHKKPEKFQLILTPCQMQVNFALVRRFFSETCTQAVEFNEANLRSAKHMCTF